MTSIFKEKHAASEAEQKEVTETDVQFIHINVKAPITLMNLFLNAFLYTYGISKPALA